MANASVRPAAEAGTITFADMTVQRMGYGSMRLTGKGFWGPPGNPAEAVRVLRRAVEMGVNFIDTADSYGPSVAEELIAEALYPYPADLVIATKGGFERAGPDLWETNGRPEHLRRSLTGSLQRPRLDRIDLWQLHRIDPRVPAHEQFDALVQFQREGLVRHIGLSEVSVPDIERARQYFPIVSVQNRFNISDRTWEDVLKYCETERLAAKKARRYGAAGLRSFRAGSARNAAASSAPRIAIARGSSNTAGRSSNWCAARRIAIRCAVALGRLSIIRLRQ